MFEETNNLRAKEVMCDNYLKFMVQIVVNRIYLDS